MDSRRIDDDSNGRPGRGIHRLRRFIAPIAIEYARDDRPRRADSRDLDDSPSEAVGEAKAAFRAAGNAAG